jgi:hypothetical protein
VRELEIIEKHSTQKKRTPAAKEKSRYFLFKDIYVKFAKDKLEIVSSSFIFRSIFI